MVFRLTILLYGTSWYRNQFSLPGKREVAPPHENRFGDYSKYFPGETRYTRSADSSGLVPVRINNHGFRGKDFAQQKQPGLVRVLTMGASSTFGYRNADDETYPYYLQEILDSTDRGPRYEVINFSIPHANSSNILAMFLAEGVQLQPDIVTLYEGLNDSAAMEVERSEWFTRLPERLLILEYARGFARFVKPDDMKTIQEILEPRSAAYLENLGALLEECRKRDIRLIVMTQQAQSLMVPPDRLKGMSYQHEVRWVERALSAGRGDGGAAGTQMVDAARRLTYGPIFLVHAGLMRDLREWARVNRVELVDVIGLLDDRRDLLLSWVHLHPEANRKIAEALAKEIQRSSGQAIPSGTAKALDPPPRIDAQATPE